jgi:heavy metal sensor kinase
MKIAKSIRWQLQIWYGLILVAVLAGFGLTAYQLDSGRQFGRVDNDLHRHLAAVVDALHPHGPPPGEHPPLEGPPPDQFSPDAQAPNGPPIDDMDRHDHRSLKNFELPPRVALLFETNQNSAAPDFFLVIRDRNGELITQRGVVPEHLAIPPPPPAASDHPGPGPESHMPMVTLNGQYRVLSATLPGRETIVIGSSISAETKEMRETAISLILVGLAILSFGLAGGWWMVSRAIQPIADISQTAVKISSGDLSQRINVAETGSELGELAAVLNSTFARLETAFAQQQQFTADAAHELRTPVSVIITQTQMALNRDRSAADYKATVEACQRAAQRMRRLLESLLELAHFDAGQEKLKHVAFDLAPIVEDSLHLVQPLAGEKGVQIFTDLKPAKITGDPERIGQVLVNLLTNAIQYNQPGGEARVGIQAESTFVLISVSNTGPGISAEDLPRVTERFYRADKSRSSSGNGLGLSICRAIIAAHGGTLEITSEAGRGAAVIVRLPAKQAPLTP